MTSRTLAIQAAAIVAEQRNLGLTTTDVAALLAAATPYLIPCPAGKLPAEPTHRLIQSLQAQGWPLVTLAAELDMFPGDLCQLMRRPHVLERTAKTIRNLHARLHPVDPVEYGVSRQGLTRSLNRARAGGWAVIEPDADRTGAAA